MRRIDSLTLLQEDRKFSKIDTLMVDLSPEVNKLTITNA